MHPSMEQRIAHNLSVLRQTSGLSQNDLASRLSICRSTYSQYEQGHRLPDVSTLYSISRFFHVKLDTILNRDAQAVLREFFLYRDYTREEARLLSLYHSLSDFSKGRLIERAEELAHSDRLRRQDALLRNG